MTQDKNPNSDLSGAPLTERVKTFEDALALYENGHLDYLSKSILEFNGKDPILLSTQAYLMLCIIASVLNEGWVSNLTNHRMGYRPHFSEHGLPVYCIDISGPSPITFKDPNVAKYATKQFLHIYKQFHNI
jgi:hypothetical protein